MSGATRAKLMAMMFLQFFIWGAWLPQSFGFWGEGGLGFSEGQAMALDICFPVAAIIAMFVANQLVDRNFAAEKFLAVSQLIGGLAMLGFAFLARQAFSGENPTTPSFWLFFACMAVHCFFYVPGMSVTNAILFAHATDPKKDFGPIRLFGTIGWIAAAWPFIFILTDWGKVAATETNGFIEWLGAAMGTPLEGNALKLGKTWTFMTAGIASLMLAALSLTLPHTPPKANSGSSIALLDALVALLRHPFLIVLFIVTAIDATVHDGFFFFGFSYIGSIGVKQNWVQAAMTVGQLAEILTMAILGMVLARLGWRYTLAIGVFGHALRFIVWAGIYASGTVADPAALQALPPDQVEAAYQAATNFGTLGPWLAVGINVIHGVCYAFFFATLYILVDIAFPKDTRASAQGLFNFLIFGFGPIVSRFLWRFLNGIYTVSIPLTADPESDKKLAIVDYSQVLLYPAGAAILGTVLLLLFFRPPADIDAQSGTAPVGH